MFATLFSFGGSQVITRYFPYFADSHQRRASFSKLLIGFAFICIAIFSFGFIFFHNNIAAIYASKSPLFISYLWYLLPLTISLIFYGIIESSVIVQGYPIMPAMMREVYTRGIITIATICFIFALVVLSGFFWIVTVLYCLSPVLLFFYGYNKELFPLKSTINNIQKTEFKDMTHFGAFMFIGNASAVVLTNIDSVVLSAYLGLTSTGIYGIALVIAVIIEIPKRSLSQVLIPLVVKANKENDHKTLDLLYKKSSLNQFIIGAAIFLIVWMNIDGIFSLIPNVLASVFLYNTMRFIFIAIVMKIQPFTKKTFVAGFCAVITYGIVWMIPHISIPVIDIIFQTLCIGIILGSLILGLRVSEDISNSFYKVLARIRTPD
jgi:O-antigen/teichoic acid export membrane protein